MKISILEIIGDSSLAGAPRHFLSVIENLDLDKFQIHAICPPGPLAGEIRKLKRHIDLDLVQMRSRLDCKAIGKLRKEMVSLKPDIIHVHGTRAGALGRLASIGLNIPVVYTEHLWTKHYSINNPLLRSAHMFGNWFFDIFTTTNIAVSEAVKEFMVESGVSRSSKIKVIYNGVEPPKHKADIFQNKEEFRLTSVGTLNPLKGMQFLIQAIVKVKKEFPGVHLEIIGDGPSKKKLAELIRKLKLKNNVKLTGFVPDVEKYLTNFDLYIQPSLSESFGLAIVQAMGVGLPIVATNAGGIPEVVTDGKSGTLVPTHDSKALSAAILELLRDQEKAKSMGRFAAEEAKRKFDLTDMIKDLENLYEKVVSNPVIPE